MRVLIVGGAGFVGTILRPALMAEHDCTCFDLVPVEEMGERNIVGDVNDLNSVRTAVANTEAVVYLPLGGVNEESDDYLGTAGTKCTVAGAFKVQVEGFYRFLWEGLAAGVTRFVYASSLSVYRSIHEDLPLSEDRIPDGWDPYAVSKQLGEHLCTLAAGAYPEACFVALRLMLPTTEEGFRDFDPMRYRNRIFVTGPRDLANLFLAALACPQPGAHVVQATGDIDGACYPNHRVTELLSWKPQGA